MRDEPIFKSIQAKDKILGIYEQFLAAIPYKNEQLMIPTRHGKTFCICCGDQNNPPLILIHGSGSNSSIWAEEMEKYSEHFRVYALDIIGEPGKSELTRPSMDGDTYAQWLMDIIKYLNMEKGSVNILGMSLGGWMALRFATHYPEYVKRLALLCTAGITNLRLSFALKSILCSLQGDEGIRKICRMLSHPQPLHPEAEEIIMLISKSFNYRRYIPLFSDDELEKLTMPVLFIGGAVDVMFPSEKSGKRLSKLLSRLTVDIIPNTSHVLINMYPRTIPFLKP